MSENNHNPLKKYIQDLTPSLHGGLVRVYAEKYHLDEKDILDLSASLNPYGSPFDHPEYGLSYEKLSEEAYDEAFNYPDNRYLLFRKAAASFLGSADIGPDNIIPGNGSTETIRLFTQCVLNEGDRVIIPYPTFAEYEIQCRLQKAEVVYVKIDDVPDISDDLLKSARILFICNPNNPDGRLWTRGQLIALAEKCRRCETVLYVDEAFIELADPSQSIADIAVSDNYIFVMRSLTKAFALPGIRLGFGVASKEIADALNTARLSWNLSPLQEKAGAALMSMEGGVYSDYLEKSRQLIREEGAFLKEKLGAIRGFETGVLTTNFLLVDISRRMIGSSEIVERLAARGVLVRNCASFKGMGDSCIRVAVRTRPESLRLLEALNVVFKEWAQDFADNELRSHIQERLKGNNRNNSRETCQYYPCHFRGQDCTLCYCPFYPCKDERTGAEFIISNRTGEHIWSCTDCYIPHITSVADRIMDYLMAGEDTDAMLRKAWQEVIIPILEERDDDRILEECRNIRRLKEKEKEKDASLKKEN
ncbi:threonine-phosphate decarboxylase [Methanosarcinaceae archaeon]|nr:threonine-phosphate decarboxylase [Methanosarcinaceae archaeon]